eukprot:4062432-Lingulodinium_polyedra.AAC.1
MSNSTRARCNPLSVASAPFECFVSTCANAGCRIPFVSDWVPCARELGEKSFALAGPACVRGGQPQRGRAYFSSLL